MTCVGLTRWRQMWWCVHVNCVTWNVSTLRFESEREREREREAYADGLTCCVVCVCADVNCSEPKHEHDIVSPVQCVTDVLVKRLSVLFMFVLIECRRSNSSLFCRSHHSHRTAPHFQCFEAVILLSVITTVALFQSCSWIFKRPTEGEGKRECGRGIDHSPFLWNCKYTAGLSQTVA